ncbi:MAG: hypothetical protein AYK19_05555 [Theionarchaea archaeon DG-70-1]|nr:MAG: hypothetical protein AYK19_05555 [Theionarchaea archaeon DG-70-1]
MQVELDIFSGRPNPYWDLTPQEAAEFLNLFRTLPERKVEGHIREGLGYRGFLVREKGGSIEGYDEILVSGEVVVARWDKKLRQFTDKDRMLERWLLRTGKSRLDEDLYQHIFSEIENMNQSGAE